MVLYTLRSKSNISGSCVDGNYVLICSTIKDCGISKMKKVYYRIKFCVFTLISNVF
jgi:hypothetical protein